MASKSSFSNIIKLSIPIFFANLAIPLVAIVDTGLMGNLGNASYLTAVRPSTSPSSLRIQCRELELRVRCAGADQEGGR